MSEECLGGFGVPLEKANREEMCLAGPFKLEYSAQFFLEQLNKYNTKVDSDNAYTEACRFLQVFMEAVIDENNCLKARVSELERIIKRD